MEEQWVKAKVKRFDVRETGEEAGVNFKNPMLMEFDNHGKEKDQGWLEFVLRDIQRRNPSVEADLVGATQSIDLNNTPETLNNATTQPTATLPGEPFRPDVPVPVLPSRFEEDEQRKQETAEEREQRMVHDVYETIAPHFSKTRYKVGSSFIFAQGILPILTSTTLAPILIAPSFLLSPGQSLPDSSAPFHLTLSV